MKDTVIVRRLRPYEKIKLRRFKRQKRNAVNSRHARIVLLSSGGMHNSGIASLGLFNKSYGSRPLVAGTLTGRFAPVSESCLA
jgi:hypothetical protein